MPCRDSDFPSYSDELPNVRNRLSKVEAMLCASLTFLETTPGRLTELGQFLAAGGEKETGIAMSDIAYWFDAHKEKDAKRRAKEAYEAKKLAAAEEAKENEILAKAAEIRRKRKS